MRIDSRRRLAWTALAGSLAAVLVLRAAEPPEVLPEAAPAHAFSGERARTVLARLLADGTAHPVGSPAHAALQGRVRHEFEALGLATEIQSALTASSAGNVVWVENVLATLPGTDARHPLIVCAHYDSVAAGPGASDDGAGVAALVEIARALRAEGTPRSDVVFLVTDGEEAGLAGARAFVERFPRIRDVLAVVNVEARGTCGRSLLFETCGETAGAIALYARAVPHPSATSVSDEIYARMPNDTDLSVFRQHGARGLNFAFVDGFRRYHTPLDDLAHLDVRSLQHQGEQALAVVRELARADPEALPGGRSVYFDVLGRWLVAWPEGAGRVAAAMVLAAWAVFLARAVRAGRTTWRATGAGALAVLGIVLAGAAVAVLVPWALLMSTSIDAERLQDLPRLSLPAFAAAALVVWAVARTRFFGARVLGAPVLGVSILGAPDGETLARGLEACTVVLAVTTAFFVPGASYLFLLSTLTPLALDVFLPARLRFGIYQTIPALVVALLLALPLARGIELAFPWNFPSAAGPFLPWFAAHLPITLPIAWIAVHVAPMARASERDGRAVTAALAGAVLLGAGALALPGGAPAEGHPGWLSLVHVDRAEGADAVRGAQSFGGPYPPLADAAGELQPNTVPPLASYPRILPGRALTVPRSAAPAPELVVLEDRRSATERRVRVHLRSRRAATTFVFGIPEGASVTCVRANGGEVSEGLARRVALAALGIDAGGVEIEIVAPAAGELVLEAADLVYGLPPEADALVRSRPAGFVPRSLGDVWISATRLRP